MKQAQKHIYSIFESKVALDYLTRFSDPFPPYRKFGFFPDIEKKEVTKEEIDKMIKFFKRKLRKKL